jgi:hypothetical protein
VNADSKAPTAGSPATREPLWRVAHSGFQPARALSLRQRYKQSESRAGIYTAGLRRAIRTTCGFVLLPVMLCGRGRREFLFD